MTEIEKLEMEKHNDALYEAYKRGEITMDEWLDNVQVDLDDYNFDDLFDLDPDKMFDNVDEDVFTPRPDDEIDVLFKQYFPEENDEKEVSIPAPVVPLSNKRIRVIKGNSIDLNKVFDIETIEREHNGKTTYGIKFIFKGKNKYYRIVWFNENIKQRDKVYEQEKQIWQEKN